MISDEDNQPENYERDSLTNLICKNVMKIYKKRPTINWLRELKSCEDGIASLENSFNNSSLHVERSFDESEDTETDNESMISGYLKGVLLSWRALGETDLVKLEEFIIRKIATEKCNQPETSSEDIEDNNQDPDGKSKYSGDHMSEDFSYPDLQMFVSTNGCYDESESQFLTNVDKNDKSVVDFMSASAFQSFPSMSVFQQSTDSCPPSPYSFKIPRTPYSVSCAGMISPKRRSSRYSTFMYRSREQLFRNCGCRDKPFKECRCDEEPPFKECRCDEEPPFKECRCPEDPFKECLCHEQSFNECRCHDEPKEILAICYESPCLQRIQELLDSVNTLNMRVNSLAKREAERSKLVVKADKLWNTMEKEFGNKLEKSNVSQEAILKSVTKLVNERRTIAISCEDMKCRLTKHAMTCECIKARTEEMKNQLVAAFKLKTETNHEFTNLDKSLQDMQVKILQTETNTKFQLEHNRRKLELLKAEVQSQKLLKKEYDKTFATEFCTACSANCKCAQTLNALKDETMELKEKLKMMKAEREKLASNTVKSRENNQKLCADLTKMTLDKRAEIDSSRKNFNACMCRPKKTIGVQVGRSPSIARMAKSSPDVFGKEDAPVGVTMLDYFIENVFGGIKEDEEKVSVIPCGVLRILTDDKSKKCPDIKSFLKNYIMKQFRQECILSITTAIENYRGLWLKLYLAQKKKEEEACFTPCTCDETGQRVETCEVTQTTPWKYSDVFRIDSGPEGIKMENRVQTSSHSTLKDTFGFKRCILNNRTLVDLNAQTALHGNPASVSRQSIAINSVTFEQRCACPPCVNCNCDSRMMDIVTGAVEPDVMPSYKNGGYNAAEMCGRNYAPDHSKNKKREKNSLCSGIVVPLKRQIDFKPEATYIDDVSPNRMCSCCRPFYVDELDAIPVKQKRSKTTRDANCGRCRSTGRRRMCPSNPGGTPSGKKVVKMPPAYCNCGRSTQISATDMFGCKMRPPPRTCPPICQPSYACPPMYPSPPVCPPTCPPMYPCPPVCPPTCPPMYPCPPVCPPACVPVWPPSCSPMHPCRQNSKRTSKIPSLDFLPARRTNSSHSNICKKMRSRSRERSPSCPCQQRKRSVSQSSSRSSCMSNRPTSPYQKCVGSEKKSICRKGKKVLNNHEMMRPYQTKYSNDKLINDRLIISPVLIRERRKGVQEKERSLKTPKNKSITEHPTPPQSGMKRTKTRSRTLQIKQFGALYPNPVSMDVSKYITSAADVSMHNPTMHELKQMMHHDSMFSSRTSTPKKNFQRTIIKCEGPLLHYGRHVRNIVYPRSETKCSCSCGDSCDCKICCVKEYKKQLCTKDFDCQCDECSADRINIRQGPDSYPNIMEGNLSNPKLIEGPTNKLEGIETRISNPERIEYHVSNLERVETRVSNQRVIDFERMEGNSNPEKVEDCVCNGDIVQMKLESVQNKRETYEFIDTDFKADQPAVIDRNVMCVMCPSITEKQVSAVISHYDKETDYPKQSFADGWTAISKHVTTVNQLRSVGGLDLPFKQSNNDRTNQRDEIPVLKTVITQTSSILDDSNELDSADQPIVVHTCTEIRKPNKPKNIIPSHKTYLPTKFSEWERERETMSFEYETNNEQESESEAHLNWPGVQKTFEGLFKGLVDRVKGIKDMVQDNLPGNYVVAEIGPDEVNIERIEPKMNIFEDLSSQTDDINDSVDTNNVIEPPNSFSSSHSTVPPTQCITLANELHNKLQRYVKKCDSKHTLITESLIQTAEISTLTSNLRVEYELLAKRIENANRIPKDGESSGKGIEQENSKVVTPVTPKWISRDFLPLRHPTDYEDYTEEKSRAVSDVDEEFLHVVSFNIAKNDGEFNHFVQSSDESKDPIDEESSYVVNKELVSHGSETTNGKCTQPGINKLNTITNRDTGNDASNRASTSITTSSRGGHVSMPVDDKKRELTSSSLLVRNLQKAVEKKHDKKNINGHAPLENRDCPRAPTEETFPLLELRDRRFIEGVFRNNETISVQFPERPSTIQQEAATEDVGCETRTVRSTAN